MKTILESGTELQVNNYLIDDLVKEELIYYCDICNLYHITSGILFLDIEKRIKELEETR